jgi:sulfur carrier protein
MLTLTINGEQKVFEDKIPQNISQLLKLLNIAEEAVVAEVDGNIVPRKDFAVKQLNNDNKIELIRFVGGG